MRNNILFVLALFALTACEKSSDESAIRANTKAFEQAFNQKDAKALAALWTEDGKFVTPESGIVVQGRSAIEEKYAAFFQKHPEAKIEIKTESVTFPTSNEAIDVATAVVRRDNDVLEQTAYKAFYARQNGKWLITQVRQVPYGGPPERSPHLMDLKWLIGDWVDEDEDSLITTQFKWDKYQNFLIHTFTVTVEGTFELEGKEIIGWDPIRKMIRSWLFDSDGGYGEGTWRKEGGSWIVETSHTLSDGRKASSINIFTPEGSDKYTWQATGRSVGGEMLPDIDPVTVVRKVK